MQLGAINSLNFGKQYRHPSKPDTDKDAELYKIEDLGFPQENVSLSETKKNTLSAQERMAVFENKVAQIQANVRPETCILTAGTILLAIAKGKNIANFIGKVGVYAGGMVASAMTKAGGAIGNAAKTVFKGKAYNEAAKLAHKNAVNERLARFSFDNLDEVAKKIGAPDKNFVEGVGKRVNVFVQDQEKAKDTTRFITETVGINSKSSVALSALGGLFGWKAGDGGGDVLEAVLDNKEIEKEYNKLFDTDAA
ncbi:MAG: hypothetical protein IJ877_00690 [Candidatus Gastranaerophilales bacterium]|nr:hypothetical protein [Candidatus Gastranaerophilales bacterium]